jgi:hypothetical protein
LRHSATSQKVADSKLDVANNFFFLPVYLILPAALGPEVYSVSNRNEYHKQKKIFLGSRGIMLQAGRSGVRDPMR